MPASGDEVSPGVGAGDDVPAALDSYYAPAREQTRRPAASRWLARPQDVRGRVDRRRDTIVAEIERNRRGEHRVPTWVLALVLVAMVAAIAAFVLLG
jgi:hypothetical protein